ncbi:ImmA/IrrE family metallo-endopeptidase [Candidatus Binatus sp.]|jgi:Zn-dependent peptidase ImmA (M78 family)|uniref:ImmA/IrrE family metallo-endopeptidase n=1 Tax=Candidatus Binatus sp. TaxID=2811406 RepID=UPI003BC84782
MDSERREHILRAVVEVIEKLRRQLEAGLDRQVIDFDLLPTDLDAIATSLGLKVKIENELDGSTALASETLGAVYRKRKEIQIAGGKKHTRQRFTLAHELGHYLLHDQLVSYREVLAPSEAVDATNRPAIEQEADFFAVELLMPARSVGRVFQQYFGGPINGTVASDDVAHFLSQGHRPFSASEIVRMGKHERARLFARIATYAGVQFKPICEVFDVSMEAMAIRLENLGLVK